MVNLQTYEIDVQLNIYLSYPVMHLLSCSKNVDRSYYHIKFKQNFFSLIVSSAKYGQRCNRPIIYVCLVYIFHIHMHLSKTVYNMDGCTPIHPSILKLCIEKVCRYGWILIWRSRLSQVLTMMPPLTSSWTLKISSQCKDETKKCP